MMKKLMVSAVALMVSGSAVWAQSGELPDTQIKDVASSKKTPFNQTVEKGKVTIVSFWATWCVPCMKEMPYLQAVYDKYKDNPKVMFMVINTGSDNTLADAQKWNGNKKYGFPVYYTDEKKLGERFGFNVIPSTFIINPDGYIQFRNVGFEGPAVEHTLKTAIDLLLEELPGQP